MPLDATSVPPTAGLPAYRCTGCGRLSRPIGDAGPTLTFYCVVCRRATPWAQQPVPSLLTACVQLGIREHYLRFARWLVATGRLSEGQPAPQPEPDPDDPECEWCGVLVPDGASAHAPYCSRACATAARRHPPDTTLVHEPRP